MTAKLTRINNMKLTYKKNQESFAEAGIPPLRNKKEIDTIYIKELCEVGIKFNNSMFKSGSITKEENRIYNKIYDKIIKAL